MAKLVPRPSVLSALRLPPIAANNEFADGGFGVFSDEGARDVAITWNRFERHNGAGIFFADSTTGIRQHDILVERNKSVDDKTFATFFASARVRMLANAVRARVGDPAFPEEVSAIRARLVYSRVALWWRARVRRVERP
jgi:hypothetical protein